MKNFEFIPYGKHNISEEDIKSVINVLKSDFLTQGPTVESFETMFSKKIHEAVGTSATLGFFIAFPGVIILMISGSSINDLPPFSIGYLNLAIVLLVSSTSIFTANIGAKVSVSINKVTLRRIFSIFLLLTCLSIIMEHYII